MTTRLIQKLLRTELILIFAYKTEAVSRYEIQSLSGFSLTCS